MPKYSLPSYIVSACRKGLKYHEAGFSGPGLTGETVRQARLAVSSGEWDDAKIIKASAWFKRHESDLVEGSFDKDRPKPGGVAWLLWGSDPANGDKGRAWIDKKADKIKRQKSQEVSYAEGSEPAPPEDRIEGSEKNEPGSASADGSKIEVSEAVENALRNKVKEHNEENPQESKRASLSVLKKVYRRGAGAYSTSHRPNVSRAAWAMARVNAFLFLLKKGKPQNPKYITDFDLLPEGHPMAKKEEDELMMPEGESITFSMEAQTLSEFQEGDVHVMRMGPLYDLDSGDLILDLTPELAKMISSTTMKLIEANHSVPISLEHGIETGYRGEPGSDRRPYGLVDRVYYLEEDEEEGKPAGIYAGKQWTALGMEYVAASQTSDGKTALKVSPRVKFGKAYHPKTGEELGSAYFDVLAITTLPRQDSLLPLEMSRGGDSEEVVDTVEEGFEKEHGFDMIEENLKVSTQDTINLAHPLDAQKTQEGVEMSTKEKKEAELIVLLNRDTAESRALFKAAGVEGEENIEILTEHLSRQVVELNALRAEVHTFREEKEVQEKIAKEAEVDGILEGHEFDSEAEKSFFRNSLLSDSEDVVKGAMNALQGRTKIDEIANLEAVITEAKEAGSIPADFNDEKIKELCRLGNAELAIEIVKAFPAASVVRTGDASGTSIAVEPVELSREEAGLKISQLAREKVRAEGLSLKAALTIVKEENQDLHVLSQKSIGGEK